MKHIVSIAYSSEDANCDIELELLGEQFHLEHFSTNYDLQQTQKLLKHYDSKCDAICLSGLPPKLTFGGTTFVHREVHRLKNLTKDTPLLDGQELKDVYIPYAFRKLYMKNRYLFDKKKIGFISGLLQRHLLQIFEEFNHQVILADSYYFYHLPLLLRKQASLSRLVSLSMPLLKNKPLKKGQLANFSFSKGMIPWTLKELFDCDIIVANRAILNDICPELLKGKVVITDYLTESCEEFLRNAKVSEVISCLPQIASDHFLGFAEIEGIMQAKYRIKGRLQTHHILDCIEQFKLEPVRKKLYDDLDLSPVKFAFVVHPINNDQLYFHPLLKKLKPWIKGIEWPVKEALQMIPGIYYGKIKNITSKHNGRRAECLVYAVAETTEYLVNKNPESVYSKLINISHKAKKSGAKILGLGAYTKVIGDAGETVGRDGPLPVTTGNALSVASILWALNLTLEKINIHEGENGVFDGTVMIIGATGSIGSVCAKLLAKKWKRLVLVSPRGSKLLELNEKIKKLAPDCQVLLTTSADEYLEYSDAIITCAGSRNQKVLDIDKVPSGTIICDVARPFDIDEEDVVRRPDVMVITSGDVRLPGDDLTIEVQLGGEGQLVDACLAETALLALEGKFESFTTGKSFHYKRVIEIDQLAKKHGVTLAGIMGHSGPISEQEFELFKQHVAICKKLKKEIKGKNSTSSGELYN